MSKVFDWDGRKGSLIDSVSKTAGTLTAGTGGFRSTEKGKVMLFDGNITKLDTDLPSADLGLTGDITIETFVKFNSTGEISGRVLDNGKLFLSISSSNNKLAFSSIGSDAIFSAFDAISFNKYYHIIVTRNLAGDETNFYINNFLSGTADQDSGTPESGTTNLIIGNNDAQERAFDGMIAKVIIHNKILDAQERAKAYNEFLHSYNIEPPIRGFVYPKPKDLSNTPGLVAAYNMIPQNGTLVDISGNGNNGTIIDALSTTDGMKFNGTTNGFRTSNISLSGDLSIVFRGNSILLTEQVICASSTSNRVQYYPSIKRLTFRAGGGDTISLTGGSFNTNEDTDIIITREGTTIKFYQDGLLLDTDTESSANTLVLNLFGGRNTEYWKGEFKDLKIYNRAFTPQQAKAYHNSFAKQIDIDEDFSSNAVGWTL